MLSVIIPLGKNRGFPSTLVDQILSQLDSIDECIVVFDGHVRSIETNAITITNSGKNGGGGTRNAGAEIAKNEFILFLDSDVSIPENFIQTIKQAMENDPNSILTNCYNDEIKYKSLFSTYYNVRITGGYALANPQDSPLLSACMAIRKEVFFKVGCFIDNKILQTEDIEFGCRAKMMSHKVVQLRSTNIIHHKELGFISLLKNDYSRSRDRMKILHYPHVRKFMVKSGSVDHTQNSALISLSFAFIGLFSFIFGFLENKEFFAITIAAFLGISLIHRNDLRRLRKIQGRRSTIAMFLYLPLDYLVIMFGLSSGLLFPWGKGNNW